MTADVTADIGSDLVDLSLILSIAVSVQQLGSESGISYEEALKIWEDEAESQQKMLLTKKGAKESVVKELVYIPTVLLEELREQAEKCANKHAADLRAAGDNPAERITAHQLARRCMCRRLNDVKRHNRGKLPDLYDFHHWWVAYHCTEELRNKLV